MEAEILEATEVVEATNMKKSYLEDIKERHPFQTWIEKAKTSHLYMTVNNSSWHMSVFPEYHTTLTDVLTQMESEKEDPMSYSETSIVWDLRQGKAVYVWNSVNLLGTASKADYEKYWKEKKERSMVANKINERKRRMAEAEIASTKQREQREAEYGEYVKNCAVLGQQSIPFYQFNDDRTRT